MLRSAVLIVTGVFYYACSATAGPIDPKLTCENVNLILKDGSADAKIDLATLIIDRFDNLDEQAGEKGRKTLKDNVTGTEYGQMLKAMFESCADTPQYTLEYEVYGLYLAFRIVFLHEKVGDLNLE